MLTYTMSIPVEQYDSYIAHGWALVGMDPDRPGFSIVSKGVEAAGVEGPRNLIIGEVTKPSLIQRGSIRRPLGKYKGARFLDAASFAHMGSADFAHNALPDSLRRIYHTYHAFDVFKAENIFLTTKDNRSYALRLFTRLRGVELEKYVNWLSALRDNLVKTRAPSGFTRLDFDDSTLPTETDLWWDIRNDVIFSFDKNFMTRLREYMDVSMSIMDGTYEANTIRRMG